MKFGLQIEKGKIQSEFGGVGESIANSFNKNNDVFYLRDIIKKIRNINRL